MIVLINLTIYIINLKENRQINYNIFINNKME